MQKKKKRLSFTVQPLRKVLVRNGVGPYPIFTCSLLEYIMEKKIPTREKFIASNRVIHICTFRIANLTFRNVTQK